MPTSFFFKAPKARKAPKLPPGHLPGEAIARTTTTFPRSTAPPASETPHHNLEHQKSLTKAASHESLMNQAHVQALVHHEAGRPKEAAKEMKAATKHLHAHIKQAVTGRVDRDSVSQASARHDVVHEKLQKPAGNEDHEKKVLHAVKQAYDDGHDFGGVSIRRAKKTAGLPPEHFDSAALRLHHAGKVSLQHHDLPGMYSDEEKPHVLVRDTRKDEKGKPIHYGAIALPNAQKAWKPSASFQAKYLDTPSNVGTVATHAAKKVAAAEGENSHEKGGHVFGNKVFINGVHKQMQKQGYKGSLKDFKSELVDAHQKGHVEMARADLAGHLPAKHVKDSETHRGEGRYHFVVAKSLRGDVVGDYEMDPSAVLAKGYSHKMVAKLATAAAKYHEEAGSHLRAANTHLTAATAYHEAGDAKRAVRSVKLARRAASGHVNNSDSDVDDYKKYKTRHVAIEKKINPAPAGFSVGRHRPTIAGKTSSEKSVHNPTRAHESAKGHNDIVATYHHGAPVDIQRHVDKHAKNAKTQGFTSQDHLDAANLHHKAVKKAKKKYGHDGAEPGKAHQDLEDYHYVEHEKMKRAETKKAIGSVVVNKQKLGKSFFGGALGHTNSGKPVMKPTRELASSTRRKADFPKVHQDDLKQHQLSARSYSHQDHLDAANLHHEAWQRATVGAGQARDEEGAKKQRGLAAAHGEMARWHDQRHGELKQQHYEKMKNVRIEAKMAAAIARRSARGK